MEDIRWEADGRGFRRAAEGVDAEYRDREAPRQIGHRIRYVDSKGGRRKLSLFGSTLAQAKAKKHELEHRKARGEMVLVNKKTFNEQADLWWKVNLPTWRKKTVEAYTVHLNDLREQFGKSKLQDITLEERLLPYVTELREAGLSQSTINARMSIANGIFR